MLSDNEAKAATAAETTGKAIDSGREVTGRLFPNLCIQPKLLKKRRNRPNGAFLLHIFIDADACPVKQEVYRVARRYGLSVTLVANSRMRIPNERGIALAVVKEGLDAADDWIVGHVQPHDIVVTTDILLASRCLKKEATAIGPTGKVFTEDNIGDAVATRDLLSSLRDAGEITGGPGPLNQRDRSRFLQKLDELIQSLRRKKQSC